jgi:hypothetical protein
VRRAQAPASSVAEIILTREYGGVFWLLPGASTPLSHRGTASLDWFGVDHALTFVWDPLLNRSGKWSISSLMSKSRLRSHGPTGLIRNERVIRIVAMIALVWGAAYLGWRAVETWDRTDPVLFLLLYACELFG